MGNHLIDGQFQSDKYPTTPRGKVPLSVADVTAQDLLWQYAQRRRSVDAEFSDDLETALRSAGYVPPEIDPAAGFVARAADFLNGSLWITYAGTEPCEEGRCVWIGISTEAWSRFGTILRMANLLGQGPGDRPDGVYTMSGDGECEAWRIRMSGRAPDALFVGVRRQDPATA
jgi:hypothetical protein